MVVHPSIPNRALTALLLLWSFAATADAASYLEDSIGEISGLPSAPTTWPLDPGANALSGSAGGGDVDLVHIVVPSGHALTSLILDSYVNLYFGVSFIGVAGGATWPTGVDYEVDPEVILGWVHFGMGDGAEVGDDLLPLMSISEFAPGFDLPLAAGDYTFDLQDVDFPMSYAMTFIVTPVPEPATLALLAPPAVGWVRRRRGRPLGS